MSKASRAWKKGIENIFHTKATLKDYRKMKRFQDRITKDWKKDFMFFNLIQNNINTKESQHGTMARR